MGVIEQAKQKLISLARSQVGYREGPNNYNKYADDPKVIQLYGWNPQNQPWCCVFANWCYLNAFGYDIGSRLTYGGTAACSSSAQLFKNNGAWSSTPQIGDQAFFNQGGGINHTGIVVAVSGGDFTTVEGNYSDKVSLVQHNAGLPDVAGFGRPDWKILETGAPDPEPSKPSDPEPQVDHSLKLPMIRKGSKGAAVYAAQGLLELRKFSVGGIDGDFGPKTAAAVLAFQDWAEVSVDGIVGPDTWKKLLEV